MMSLNRMPGLGKSAMSRRREAHCGATMASVMSHWLSDGGIGYLFRAPPARGVPGCARHLGRWPATSTATATATACIPGMAGRVRLRGRRKYVRRLGRAIHGAHARNRTHPPLDSFLRPARGQIRFTKENGSTPEFLSISRCVDQGRHLPTAAGISEVGRVGVRGVSRMDAAAKLIGT